MMLLQLVTVKAINYHKMKHLECKISTEKSREVKFEIFYLFIYNKGIYYTKQMGC